MSFKVQRFLRSGFQKACCFHADILHAVVAKTYKIEQNSAPVNSLEMRTNNAQNAFQS